MSSDASQIVEGKGCDSQEQAAQYGREDALARQEIAEPKPPPKCEAEKESSTGVYTGDRYKYSASYQDEYAATKCLEAAGIDTAQETLAATLGLAEHIGGGGSDKGRGEEQEQEQEEEEPEPDASPLVLGNDLDSQGDALADHKKGPEPEPGQEAGTQGETQAGLEAGPTNESNLAPALAIGTIVMHSEAGPRDELAEYAIVVALPSSPGSGSYEGFKAARFKRMRDHMHKWTYSVELSKPLTCYKGKTFLNVKSVLTKDCTPHAKYQNLASDQEECQRLVTQYRTQTLAEMRSDGEQDIDTTKSTDTKEKTHLKIMQWNMKQLTNGNSKNAAEITKKAQERRNDMIYHTIRQQKDLSVAVLEEVSKKGGLQALQEVVMRLNNAEGSDDDWDLDVARDDRPRASKQQRYERMLLCSDAEPLGPYGGGSELYAVIWRKSHVGVLRSAKRLFYQEGFGGQAETEEESPITRSKEESLPRFTICVGPDDDSVTVDMADAQQVWHALRTSDEVTVVSRFKRCPVAFSFCCDDGVHLHIVATHSRASQKNFANALEACFLQHLVTQWVKQGQFVVLLGDFNSDEAGTQGMWEEEGDLPTANDEDAEGRLRTIRDEFLRKFVRVFEPARPTNVYPFLASKDAKPMHNDDIWLPNLDKPPKLPFSHCSGPHKKDDGRREYDKIVRVPDNVLKAWADLADWFFENDPTTKSTAKLLTNALAFMWSDHRPLWVLIVKPDKQEAMAAKAAQQHRLKHLLTEPKLEPEPESEPELDPEQSSSLLSVNNQ